MLSGSPVFAASEKFINETQVLAQINPSAGTLQSNTAEPEILTMQPLYNFQDECIAILYTLSPNGYAIYDPSKQIVLEYSMDSIPQYLQTTDTLYYTGVLGYYTKNTSGDFVHIVSGQTITQENAMPYTSDNFYASEPSKSMVRANEYGHGLSGATRLYDCNTTANLREFYPDTAISIDDCPGVCGSTACAIVAAYLDDYHSELGDFADNTKKNSYLGTENKYGLNLVKEFIPFIEPNATGSILLNPGMKNYLSTRGINGMLSLGTGTIYNQVKLAIETHDYPAIVGFTNYPDTPDRVKAHYAVAVNYQSINGTNQIHINNGWGGFTWVNTSSIISVWSMIILN